MLHCPVWGGRHCSQARAAGWGGCLVVAPCFCRAPAGLGAVAGRPIALHTACGEHTLHPGTRCSSCQSSASRGSSPCVRRERLCPGPRRDPSLVLKLEELVATAQTAVTSLTLVKVCLLQVGAAASLALTGCCRLSCVDRLLPTQLCSLGAAASLVLTGCCCLACVDRLVSAGKRTAAAALHSMRCRCSAQHVKHSLPARSLGLPGCSPCRHSALHGPAVALGAAARARACCQTPALQSPSPSCACLLRL